MANCCSEVRKSKCNNLLVEGSGHFVLMIFYFTVSIDVCSFKKKKKTSFTKSAILHPSKVGKTVKKLFSLLLC